MQDTVRTDVRRNIGTSELFTELETLWYVAHLTTGPEAARAMATAIELEDELERRAAES